MCRAIIIRHKVCIFSTKVYAAKKNTLRNLPCSLACRFLCALPETPGFRLSGAALPPQA
jgi:hypothetical protein